MRVFVYIHYFFYVAWNWGLRLALVVIYHEIRGERKYGLHTIGIDELKWLEKKGIDISHATMYMPVSYYVLEVLLKELNCYPSNKTFLDIGSGRGRVMAVASAFGFTQIHGVDFCKRFCDDAATETFNCRTKNAALQFTITHAEASRYQIPAEITTIFIFNPFDEVVMNKVVPNIVDSQEHYPRTIRVVYVNPLYESIFLDAGFSELYHFKKLNYFEGVILQKSPPSAVEKRGL